MKTKQGLSLLEFVIVIVVVLLLGTFGGKALIDFVRIAHMQTVAGDVHGQSRSAFDLAAESMLTMITISGCSISSGIDVYDVDWLNTIYNNSGGTLWRESQAGSGILADNITSLDFKCLDSGGAVTTDSSLAKYIQIQMTSKKDESEVNYRTTIFLRDTYSLKR